MRRVFALLLVTPFLANCADSDSATPLAPSGAVLSLEESPLQSPLSSEWSESPLDDWTLEEWLAQAPLEVSPLQAAPGSGVLMEFGHPGVGTPYPPLVHDRSLHARDRVLPATVVVDAGQPVTFRVYPGHRVAIYKDGVRPEDIAVNFFPGPFVLDPTNRVALQGAPVPVISWTFSQPGRYLVICAVKSHFVVANMYGWVIVR